MKKYQTERYAGQKQNKPKLEKPAKIELMIGWAEVCMPIEQARAYILACKDSDID